MKTNYIINQTGEAVLAGEFGLKTEPKGGA